MKKLLTGILAVICTAAFAGGLAACDNGEDTPNTHTHDWSETYSYDDTSHWYDCSGCDEHTGTEAHVYDDDNDPDCNKCGAVRHVHSYKWEHDDETHWQVMTCEHHADEKLNPGRHDFDEQTGLCKDCGFDKKDIHVHDYAWKYDEKNHWEEATCHPGVIYENLVSEHSFEDGVCECGVLEVETQVYALYGANCLYKGEDALSYVEWLAEAKATDYHHMGFNDAGDAVFYYEKEPATEPEVTDPEDQGEAAAAEEPAETPVEYDQKVMYYAPRTVKVKAVVDKDVIARVWYKLQVKVNGEYVQLNGKQAIAVAMTEYEGDNLGIATITYTPVWGYTSAEEGNTVEYEITLCENSDIPQGQLPVALAENFAPMGDEVKAVTVSGEAAPEEPPVLELTYRRCLGLGERFVMEDITLKGYGWTYIYLSPALTEGYYLVRIKSTSGLLLSSGSTLYSLYGADGASIYNSVEPHIIYQGDTGDPGGNGEVLCFMWMPKGAKYIAIQRKIGDVIVNISLESMSTKLQAGKAYDVKVNYDSTSAKDQPVTYDISGIAPGKYMLEGTTKITSTIKVKIGENEAANYSTGMVVTVGENDKTMVLSQTSTSGNIIKGIVGFKFTKIEELDSPEFEAPLSSTATKLGYTYTVTEPGTYMFRIHSGTAYTGVSVSYKDLATTKAVSSLIRSSNDEVTAQYAYFEVTAETTYLFVIEASGDIYPTLDCMIAKQESTSITPGTPTNVEFDDTHSRKYYTATLTAGAYIIVLKAEDVSQYKLYVDGYNPNPTMSLPIYTYAYVRSSDAEVPIYLEQKTAGTGDGATLNFIKIDNPTNIEVGKDVTLNFTNGIAAVTYTTPDKADYYSLNASSQSDLKNLVLYRFSYNKDGQVSGSSQPFASVADSSYERSYSTGKSESANTKYLLVFAYEGGETIPSVTASVKKTLSAWTTTNDKPSINSAALRLTFKKAANETPDTVYEVYEAITDSKNTPELSAFKLVKTIKAGGIMAYSNNEHLEAGFFHYYVVAKDTSGEYMSKASPIVYTSSEAREIYTITVNIPADFEGPLSVALTYGSNQYRGYYDKEVTKGTTQVVFEVAGHNAYASTSQLYANIYSSTMLNSGMWIIPAALQFDETHKTTLTITKKTEIKVTINLPDDFDFGATVTLSLQTTDSTTSVTYANLTVDPGTKVVNHSLYAQLTEGKEYIVTITNMRNGYELAVTKVPVDFNEDKTVGTATLTINQRVKTTVTVKLPEGYDITQRITVEIFKEDADGTPAKSATQSWTLTAKEGDTSVTTAEAYLPSQYSYTIKAHGPANTGYFADDLAHVDFRALSEKEFTLTMKDRVAIEVTATVVIPDELKDVMTSNNIRLFLYEKLPDGQPDTSAVISYVDMSLKAQEDKKTLTATSTLYGQAGKEYIIGGPTTTNWHTSSQSLIWQYTPVTFDEAKTKGTASLTLEPKKTVKVSLINYTSSGNFTVALYKNGEKIDEITTASKSSNNYFYIDQNDPEKYDPAATYQVLVTKLSSGYFADTATVDLSKEGKFVPVELATTNKKAKINFTLTFSEEMQADINELNSNRSFYVGIVEIGNTSMGSSYNFKLTASQLADGTYTGVYEGYIKTSTALFTIWDNATITSIYNIASTNSTEKWIPVISAISWSQDEEGNDVGSCTVTFKKSLEATMKFVAPADFGKVSGKSNVLVDILDKDGNKIEGLNFSTGQIDQVIDIYLRSWDETYTYKVTTEVSTHDLSITATRGEDGKIAIVLTATAK